MARSFLHRTATENSTSPGVALDEETPSRVVVRHVEVAMRPRISLVGVALIVLAVASAAHAQSNVPGTWSTDPQCSARALRVTFGRDTLVMERNGHLIYRGGAQVAVSDDAIAVRLAPSGAVSERNVIRFHRGGDALRLVAATRDGAVQSPRVPPLYPCRAAAIEAASTVSPAAASVPVAER